MIPSSRSWLWVGGMTCLLGGLTLTLGFYVVDRMKAAIPKLDETEPPVTDGFLWLLPFGALMAIGILLLIIHWAIHRPAFKPTAFVIGHRRQ